MIFELADVKFEVGKLTRVQVARVCDNEVHSLYGPIKITSQDLADMKKNFEDNARGLAEGGSPILMYDYRHADGDEAAGWIRALVLSDDGQKLFADVEFTEDAKEAIKSKKWKFSSPTIMRNYENTQTKKKYNVILHGVALTNRPFLKDMEAINSLSEDDRAKALAYLQKLESDDQSLGSTESILKAISTLTPEEKMEIALKMQSFIGGKKPMTDKEKKEMTEPTEREIKLAEENAELKLKLEQNERETKFAVLLSEGKVVPAQKEAYMSGDMVKFAELAQKVHLDADGSGAEGKKDEIKTRDKAESKLEELAEAYVKANECDYLFAMREVVADPANAKLVALCE